MNNNGFKGYLVDLGSIDVREFADMLRSPEIEVDPSTGTTRFTVLEPLFGEPSFLNDFYVWLHTEARELSEAAKLEIDTIDETSPHHRDVEAIKELVERVGELNAHVNDYAASLAHYKPWKKMARTLEVWRVWIDEEGNSVGTPEKRGMEPINLPERRVKIVVIEGEPGQASAAISCSDLRYKIDASVGGIKIAQSFVFDMPKLVENFIMPNGYKRRNDSSSHRDHQLVVQTMALAAPLIDGICDMAETMHKYGCLKDPVNLYQLTSEPLKPPKAVLAEENPDAKIEIGSWS